MIKIIISSRVLFDLMRKVFAKPRTELVNISNNTDELWISGISAQCKGFDMQYAQIPIRQLNRLYNILVMLSDQPLTIEYNEATDKLTIQSVIL